MKTPYFIGLNSDDNKCQSTLITDIFYSHTAIF